MDSPCLSALAAAGIVERHGRGGGAGSFLRVSPRFLAHAEGTAGRLRLQGRPSDGSALLQVALSTWDEFGHDPRVGANVLGAVLDERDQWGPLRPVFPGYTSLEQFAGPAAA